MSHLELKQLKKAEELFDECKLDETFELLKNLDQLEELTPQQKSYSQYLKFLIFFYQNKHEELIKMGEIIFEKGQMIKNNIQLFNGLYFITIGLAMAHKFDEASERIAELEAILGLKLNLSEIALREREGRINVLKGYIYLHLVNIDLAEKSIEATLGFQKDLSNSFEIVWAHLILAQVYLRVKSRYDIAMEYTNKALSLAMEIKFNHYWIAMCHLFFGVINASIGEFEHSLEHYTKSLTIFKELKNNLFIAMVLNNSAGAYLDLSKYDLALEYLEQSLLVWERDPIGIEHPIAGIAYIAFIKGDNKLAQKYYNKLENLYNENKSSHNELLYYYVKAIKLKESSRIRDKAKAEKLFKKVIGKETLSYGIIISAYINLCDLFLAEFRINKNSDVLEELIHYINKLLIIAEKSHSYLIFCETFILQAKLSMLYFDTKAARRFLTQAQKIAEKYGLRRLAIKISYEHDKLLKELNKWEILNDSNAGLTERIELAQLDDQMAIMLKKRPLEVSEASNEDPVMILILTEGGNLLFSKKFVEDFSFEDDILGGFLTTVNYIISELFSEGLERAVFGQYTLLMMPVHPFLVCYIFKGDSYFAHHKISKFLNSIQSDSLIWQSLQNFFQKSKSVELHSIPKLDSIITEIFVEKKN